MQIIEMPIEQRNALPLPSAALVIDTRGTNDDTVIEWLSIEIADLTDEMKVRNVHHWRYLRNFLSFRSIPPLQAADRQTAMSNHTGQQGLTGIIPPSPVVDHEMQDPSFVSFEQQMAELIQEINRLRTNRTVAVEDSDPVGTPGYSVKDATVRIIFLTDIAHPESLTTAAIYAEKLKEYYRRLDRADYAPLINTTVLCLGNPGEAGPPTKLIQGLTRNNSWAHLDSLILSEDFRRDAASIGGPMQAYLAELLLYVLLIIPPLGVSLPDSPESATAAPNGQPGANGEMSPGGGANAIGLPAHTYVVGLAALEYSARWGRRWLNFGLARGVIEKLRQELPEKEKPGIQLTADVWFKGWKSRVQAAIPDKVPDDLPALQGIYRSRQVSESSRRLFTAGEFSLNIGASTTRDLQEYLARLTQIYVTMNGEPSLQNALWQGAPQIMETLHAREHKSPAERKVTELGKLQIEAEQVIGRPPFFAGATSAIPRARAQLGALVYAINDFLQKHQSNPLHPSAAQGTIQDRRDELERSGTRMIEDFKKHLAGWPFFGSLLLLKQTFAALTLLILMFLTLVTILLSFAWLHHLLVLHSVSLIDSTLQGIPALELCAWGIALLFVIGEFITCRSRFLNKNRSALQVEATFILMLIIFALFGWFINFSIESLRYLADDSSVGYIAWLAAVPSWSAVVGLIALLILVAEGAYFLWWLERLHKERRRIVARLRKQYQQDVQDVIDFIAGEVALDILKGAKLIDREGQPGDYSTRLDHLDKLLDEVAEQAQRQHFLAAQRLFLSQKESQGEGPGNKGAWLNLRIREEKLEIPVLTNEYSALREQLETESAGLQELAEFLLRAQGVEKVAEIRQQFAERPTKMSSEQRHLHLFTIAIAAFAMRFGIEPLSSHNIATLMHYYQRPGEHRLQQIPTLGVLIETINQTASRTTLASASASNIAYSEPVSVTLHSDVVADAVAIWSHLLWHNKNQKLHQALMQDSVLAQSGRQLGHNYDPRTIMSGLLTRSVLFGRSQRRQPLYDRYLLLPPSSYSYHFRQGLKNMPLPRIIDFPDPERILLLDVQQYVAQPLLLIAPGAKQDQDTKQEQQDATDYR